MHRKPLTTILTVLILWGILCSSALAETVYVNAKTAPLKSDKTASSSVIAELKRGDELSVIKKEGNWYQVRTKQGKTGWIYSFKITTKKPEKGAGLLEELGRGTGTVTAKEASTSASIRGLSPTSERYAGRANIRAEHIAGVKKMETFRVSQEDVERFLKEGRLGEYASQ